MVHGWNLWHPGPLLPQCGENGMRLFVLFLQSLSNRLFKIEICEKKRNLSIEFSEDNLKSKL